MFKGRAVCRKCGERYCVCSSKQGVRRKYARRSFDSMVKRWRALQPYLEPRLLDPGWRFVDNYIEGASANGNWLYSATATCGNMPWLNFVVLSDQRGNTRRGSTIRAIRLQIRLKFRWDNSAGFAEGQSSVNRIFVFRSITQPLAMAPNNSADYVAGYNFDQGTVDGVFCCGLLPELLNQCEILYDRVKVFPQLDLAGTQGVTQTFLDCQDQHVVIDIPLDFVTVFVDTEATSAITTNFLFASVVNDDIGGGVTTTNVAFVGAYRFWFEDLTLV